ncbi:NADP-dependent oxidoreductase [Litchfieldia alkalitelluris]|uniref:NADP-dependent oxidoreductase n=1 Tax=Litchfieldia alkalitelluris TaxID=304268 RepID=UPI0009962607|nr:NADP-dependent oxidoreductase [Litchfieldia alkalitelluris]
MKAVAIEQYGSRDQLKLMELAYPTVKPKDVLIEVHAAAVNPVDIAIREGYLHRRLNSSFPLILGYDVAGVVKEVGEKVTNFSIGDEVYSYPELTRNGTYADYVSIDESFVARKPRNISFYEAASIPLVGTAAWRGLVERGNVGHGQRVLILGGSGGVGSFAVQLAKSLGAYVVATTSRSNVDFVKKLGADEVLDYTTDHFSYEQGFDLVFDTVGRNVFEQAFEIIKADGKLITIATFPTEKDHIKAQKKGIHLEFFISDPSGEVVKKITTLIENKKVKPITGEIFSIDEIVKAHELSETNHARGKIVISIK